VPDRRPTARVTETPYLSVVVTARNDDHGGNLRARMQAFVNGLLIQCERHRVPAELIVVEWNPPPDRPGLNEALDWTAGNDTCKVRIIEVPAAVHRQFRHWQALPLYQMIAKNVGIRRARGEFILATNIDILFSDELFELLASRRLERGRMYRVDRWDVMADVPADRPIEEQLAWCRSHALRVNRRDGTFPLNPDGSMKIDAQDIISGDRGVALGANWFPRESSGTEPFRWAENDAELILAEPGDTIVSLDIEPGPGVDHDPFLLEIRSSTGTLMASSLVERRGVARLPLRTLTPETSVFLHTDYGGMRITSDLRTLNFRVFRCEAGRTSTLENVPAHPAVSKTTGGTMARLGRAARVLARAVRSVSEIRIPMSREGLRRLNLRQDESAVTFDLGPLIGSPAPVRDDVVAPGLGAIWDDRWYELERFRGDCFRWMPHKASLTVALPESGVPSIVLTVEAGPAVGFRDASLQVHDGDGTLLTTAQISGRTRVEVPLEGARGMWPLHLTVSGGRQPKTVSGDSRIMALRILRCELGAGMEHAGHFFEAAPGSGIWCLRGFHLHPKGLFTAAAAEMAVRGADCLTLDVAPRAAPARLTIRDGNGRALHDGPVASDRSITIRGEPRHGYLYLRFTCDRPLAFTSLRRAAGDETFGGFDAGSPECPAIQLHTNGCGDFTLMAREHWLDLRAYPEFDAFSMNVDSVLCWAAHHAGAREEILRDPIRIFHIEHGTGSGWTPEGEKKLYERISKKGVPWIGFTDVMGWAKTMNRFDQPMIFNHDDWGLARETLREIIPRGEACGARNV
jgi:hypothetical protein